MKARVWLWAALAAAGLSGAGTPAGAQTRPIPYSVTFNDYLVATQTVSIVTGEGTTTITSKFEAVLPVNRARHRYSEQLSVTVREDGAVEQFHSSRQDEVRRTEVSATWVEEEGGLEVIRTDSNGTSIHIIRREDYDFHSLALYGNAPRAFLPERQPARVLCIAEGRVVPVTFHTVAQSETTRERQHVASTQLTWNDGTHVSYSWHPERFNNLPSRYIRETADGRFTFTLQR